MISNADIIGGVTFALPVITLFISFLILKWDGLKGSIAAWIVEVIIVLIIYPNTRIMESTIWANFDLWTAYAVLWTGFLFREMYKNTGLLDRLITVLDSVFNGTWGKSLTISGVVGGLIGAFNGFATYPITVTAIKEFGYEKWKSAAAYLVYFVWMLPFVSMWIGATVAQTGSHLPVIDMVTDIGILTIPLVVLSTYAFAKVLGIDFKKEHNMALMWLSMIGPIVSIIIFTILLPKLYMLTLIASAVLTFPILYLYSSKKNLRGASLKGLSTMGKLKPFGPIIIGIAVILLWSTSIMTRYLDHFNYTLKLWSFAPISINLLNNAGFFILVVALCSYIFIIKQKPAPKQKGQKVVVVKPNPLRDIVHGSKTGVNTFLTIFFGSGLVGMIMSSGQLTAIKNLLVTLGTYGYGIVLPIFSWFSGVVFAQGLPADLLLSSMQVTVGSAIILPLALLVSIVVIAVMGIANPLKPSLIYYTSTMAGAPREDQHYIFSTALKWELFALVILIIEVVLAITIFYHP